MSTLTNRKEIVAKIATLKMNRKKEKNDYLRDVMREQIGRLEHELRRRDALKLKN